MRDKSVLEIGCGPGRFTQYLVKYAKLLVINDMSEAIYHNNYLSKKNVVAIKSDFTNLKKLDYKFDIIICRGVLQHTQIPITQLRILIQLCNDKGTIYFDIYRKPKIHLLNPKYIWRRILKSNLSYDKLYYF